MMAVGNFKQVIDRFSQMDFAHSYIQVFFPKPINIPIKKLHIYIYRDNSHIKDSINHIFSFPAHHSDNKGRKIVLHLGRNVSDHAKVNQGYDLPR
ncbi:hypothetical protein SDC9_163591 [bioreactor metagenome]|uniref:Uncharacterized protein n=1 Tax=bioreactor metagenome TaxID=1076179 RepID=A0A645FW98_9ZZZZ